MALKRCLRRSRIGYAENPLSIHEKEIKKSLEFFVAKSPPGCVLLRYEGMDLRRDWYVDPERDYICVKRIEFRKDQDTGQLIESPEIERADLTRLPSGQWYARTIESRGQVVAEYDVKLLTEAESESLSGKDNSTGFFNGEKTAQRRHGQGSKSHVLGSLMV